MTPPRSYLGTVDDSPAEALERYKDHMESALRTARSWRWDVGDVILRGEREFPDDYEALVDRTGLDRRDLVRCVTVARAFPPRRRRELSFEHHEALVGLPEDEQEAWLDRAVEQGLTAQRLAARLRDHMKTTSEVTS